MIQVVSRAKDLTGCFFPSHTIFHHLLQKDVSFKIYYDDIPTTLLHRDCWDWKLLAKHYTMDQFWKDTKGDADEFPTISCIEPRYHNQQTLTLRLPFTTVRT